MGQREEVYWQAHINIDTEHLPVARVVDEIIKAIDQLAAGSEQRATKR